MKTRQTRFAPTAVREERACSIFLGALCRWGFDAPYDTPARRREDPTIGTNLLHGFRGSEPETPSPPMSRRTLPTAAAPTAAAMTATAMTRRHRHPTKPNQNGKTPDPLRARTDPTRARAEGGGRKKRPTAPRAAAAATRAGGPPAAKGRATGPPGRARTRGPPATEWPRQPPSTGGRAPPRAGFPAGGPRGGGGGGDAGGGRAAEAGIVCGGRPDPRTRARRAPDPRTPRGGSCTNLITPRGRRRGGAAPAGKRRATAERRGAPPAGSEHAPYFSPCAGAGAPRGHKAAQRAPAPASVSITFRNLNGM